MGFLTSAARSVASMARMHPVAAATVFAVVALLVWLSEGALRAGALGTVEFEASFHAYMIGLVIPESAFIGLIWKQSLGRYVLPGSGRIISHAAGIGMTVAVAAIGFLLVAPAIRFSLMEVFSAWAAGSLLVVLAYWTYAIASLIIVPLLCVVAISPAGAIRALRSIWRAAI